MKHLAENELKVGSDRLVYFACDVTQESQVKAAVEGTVNAFGTVHVALASAGVNWPVQTLTSKKTIDTKVFQKVMDINLMGCVYTAKYACIAMSKNKPIDGERGVLIFISSIAGWEA